MSRLVYAPQRQFGKYGGDIDNWDVAVPHGRFLLLPGPMCLPDGSSGLTYSE